MPEYLEPEALLQHTGWMTSLARSLVLDPDRAEDVVQEVFVQVAQRRLERPRSPGAWLRGMVTHLSLRDRRSRARRRRREEAAARPERDEATTEALVERAELHRLVVDRVIGLEEPYRTAILLRYFEDLSCEEVARRQGIPLATVRTRIRRGIDRLRRELDGAHGGNRRLWLGLLAPLAGLEALPAEAAAASTTTVAAASAEEARSKFQKAVLRDLGIEESAAQALGAAFDAWEREVGPLLEPHTAKGPPRLDAALAAARAHVSLLNRLLEAPGLDEKVRSAILAVQTWTMPMVVEKKE